MAEIQERHRKAAGVAFSKNWDSANPLGTQTVEFWASLLADQEADLADALAAEAKSIELHGTLADPAGIIDRWAKKVRSGDWRGDRG